MDLWHWRVLYDDGELYDEFDDAGEPRGFGSVDQARVAAVALIPARDDLAMHEVRIDQNQGQRAIFTRRRTISVGIESGEENGRRTVHLLGWQQTVVGVNVKSIAFIFENGAVLHSSDYQAV